MYTNNWSSLLSARLLGDNASTQYINLQRLDGYSVTNMYFSQLSIGFSDVSSPMLSIRVGSNNTAPTTKDYCLKTDVTSKLVEISSTHSALVSDASSPARNNMITVTTIFKNNQTSDVEIKEIGLCIAKPNQFVPTTRDAQFMLAREVLSSPITIAPGKSYAFTMTLGA